MYKVLITGVDTSKLKAVSTERMNELIPLIKNGDSKAREEMIVGNLKLVLSVLKKFNQRDCIDDLFQVGCIGLIKAIDNFDDSHNVKFSTYAVPMIIGEIRRYLRDNGAIRVSRSLKDIAYKAINYKEEFLILNNREPTPEEIAKYLGCEPIDVIMAFEAILDPVSIFTPIYDNGTDVIELIDQISDDETIDGKYANERMLINAVNKLDKREKMIIYDRYFNDKTQVEIAEELGISQAQVSRLEKNALKRMYDEIS